MSEQRRLIFSIVQFLNRELSSNDNSHSEDAKESLEVASQCLQTAFCLSQEDTHLGVSKTLEEIFSDATQGEPLRKAGTPSEEDRNEADKMKGEGNELMRSENFEKAIEMYSKAIELDSSNQVFYCNRAAAHSKLNNHYAAIEDCKRAIDMDPKYGKAYGRMGLAYSSVDRHKEAVECFEEALKLEPDNESYKTNLDLAKEKSAAPVTARPPFPTGMMGGGPGGMDLNGLLGNPALMNMATSMLSDPNMQNMMGQLMSGGMSSGNNMEGLLQAGQRLAEQMQTSNPDLVDQLRRQMGQGGDGEQGQGGDGQSEDQPPPGTS